MTIGYSDASTDVTLTRPLVDAAAKSRLPSMSPIPISARNGTSSGGDRKGGTAECDDGEDRSTST